MSDRSLLDREWRIIPRLGPNPSALNIYCGDAWIGCLHGPHDKLSSFPSAEQMETNTAVIAAVPKMLALLEELVSSWGDYTNTEVAMTATEELLTELALPPRTRQLIEDPIEEQE